MRLTQTLCTFLFLLLTAGCAESTPSSDAMVDAPSSDAMVDAPTGLVTGESCESNAECGSGLCWDFSERDPLCGGSVCSLPCDTDTQCEDAARDAGSDNPAAASCDATGECDFVGALGAFFCA